MFVSSYSTYIHTNTVDKNTKKTTADISSSNKIFSIKNFNNIQNTAVPALNNSENFKQNHQFLRSKTKITQQEQKDNQSNTITIFKTINSQLKASNAYNENRHIFSLIPKNKPSLKQNIYSIDKDLPQDIKDIKESILKIKMVNTYISNNNYYQITA